MSSVRLTTTSTSKNEETPPTSPSQEWLVKKMASTTLGSPQNPTLNWGSTRIFTPGQSVGYKSPLGVEFANGKMQLFHSGNDSQGLILENDQVVGASVSTSILTVTNRKKETKSTFIQYDKTRVKQSGADFSVNAENRKGDVNYQGGHLIDHKYSAEKSHTTEANYFPQHFMTMLPSKSI